MSKDEHEKSFSSKKDTSMIVFICYCIATTFFTLLATNDVSWLVQHTIRHSTLILWPFSFNVFLRNTINTNFV